MSGIHIKQIGKKIRELFENHIDHTDIGINDNDRDNKILTRCLAAYGIYKNSDCSVEDAADSVVDGGDDNGIDAIYYSPLNKKMIILQSKWSNTGIGEPDSAGVSKFCTGIKDLFNTDFERFNEKIKRKTIQIKKALEEYDTKYEILFIDTHTAQNLAIHSTRHIEDILKEMNDTGDDSQDQIVSFKRLHQGKVFSSLAKSSGNDPIDLEIGLTQWGMVSEPHKAFYGMISGEEIASWWDNYETRLFEKNIRQVLGTTEVNEEIEKTLNDYPDLFWYFNNGITIICDTVTKSKLGGSTRDLGSFMLKNIAVVNGAQTVSTIGKYLSKQIENNLENVKVHLRIISLNETPERFGEDVTKTNNRQNRIENRDFVSQDPEQLRIKTELTIEGIDYSIMRSESFRTSDNSFDLNEATVSLACAKNKTSLVVQVKRGIGKYYENLEKGIYKEIFNGAIQGIYVFNCVKVNRIIEGILYNQTRLLPKRSGRKYGMLVHGNRIISQLSFGDLDISQELNSIDFEPDTNRIEQIVLNNITKVEDILIENYSENILGTLFKNSSKCNHIVELIKNANG
ncbi:AIPR family protein [Lentimicrobium sp. S6]|uniref:AIPR family protein n=1 Tax=Lentimicrobium sp. S6 TaxID=2735872 RepID=UPI0015566378|nr:AIPR family protein [Lentimicrobium sp. S6]NPD44255.1 AIPR family protein [Lentimicrobium sp. S6]